MGINKREILIYCDTPFQIMMAVHLLQTKLKECGVDVIITDHIKNYKMLSENLAALRVFRKTYFMRAYDLDYRKGEFAFTELQYADYVFHRKKYLNRLIQLEGVYDEFFVTDILESTNLIYDSLLSVNPKLKAVFYEEGPVSVLCDQNNQFLPKYYSNDSVFRKCIFKTAGYKTINGNFSYGYSSINAIAGTSYYFQIHDIPKLYRDNLQYIETLNQIWNYAPSKAIGQSFVFFEESFFMNHIESNDMRIIKDIIDTVGKENVLVKLHPRSRVNRFEEYGIKTNQDSSIPWELIALNCVNPNQTLIAVSSGSLIHPQLYWGVKQNVICLAECKEYRFPKLEEKYYKAFVEVCRKRELAKLPKDRKEFLELLKAQSTKA